MPRLNINGSPFRPRSPFSFRTPSAILASARRPLEREQEMSREIDRLQAMRRTVFSPSPSPSGQFGDRFADVAGGGSRFTQTREPTGNIWERAAQMGQVQEPSTLLGGVGAEPAPVQRRIFGQEAQAFAEEVAPREHRRYLIPEDQPFGLPGRIAREVTAVDPTTI